jgi:carboxyl-terminal processing protease
VTRRVAALAAFVLAVSLGASAAAPQAWRATALESFDEVWQTIHDAYYDPTFGGLDWDGVRAALRPKVQNAGSTEDARQVIRDMLGTLHQSHFVLMSAESAEALPGEATVPIDVRVGAPGLVVTRVAAGSTAERAGLKPGDVILSIDGQTIAAWAASATGRDDRAKQADIWRRAFRALHGEEESRAKLVVRGPRGDERTVTVARAPEAGQAVKLGNLPTLHVVFDAREATTPGGRHAGVIHFNYWMGTIDAPVAEAVDRYRHDAGLVIDLRGNSGGIAGMISGIAGQVMAEPTLLGKMQMRTASTHFSANPRLSMPDGRSVTPFAGPVAILVDELTASASECFAGALQSLGRATVFGRQTMGQALPASTKTLANGDVLMYAVGDFVTATGRRMEGQGVMPDHVEPLSVEALSSGRDLPLEAALAWFDSQAKLEPKGIRK